MADGWIRTSRGLRKTYSAPKAAPQPASAFPCPMIVRPFSAPVKSMADGQYYDDAASLRKTYKADGNPQGVDYVELGNDPIPEFKPPKVDKAARREAIKKAIAEVKSGKAPPVLQKLPTI